MVIMFIIKRFFLPGNVRGRAQQSPGGAKPTLQAAQPAPALTVCPNGLHKIMGRYNKERRKPKMGKHIPRNLKLVDGEPCAENAAARLVVAPQGT